MPSHFLIKRRFIGDKNNSERTYTVKGSSESALFIYYRYMLKYNLEYMFNKNLYIHVEFLLKTLNIIIYCIQWYYNIWKNEPQYTRI